MIENSMTLKEREKILKHLQTKTTTFTQLHVLKDAMEAHEKLEQIEQIINSADIKTWGESAIVIRIREVLEQE